MTVKQLLILLPKHFANFTLIETKKNNQLTTNKDFQKNRHSLAIDVQKT